jgi:glycosyltransferase involved in cell wall biosynthesis
VVSTVHGPYSSHMIEEGFLPSSPDVVKVARCEREAWCGSDAIVAVDEGQARIVVEQGAEPRKVSVIPNAVDVKALGKLAAAVPISHSSARPWVLVPRRLSPKNGVEVAVRALAQMAQRPVLLLAGSGPERERLEKLAAQLHLEGEVVFLGALDRGMMIPMMAAADIVAVPSVPAFGIEEATSLAALEAMALRKPVVASALGGLCHLITDGANGVLIPPGDPRALASALARLMNDGGLRTQLGREARRVVEAKFSADSWKEEHLSIYRSVLGPEAPSADAGTLTESDPALGRG